MPRIAATRLTQFQLTTGKDLSCFLTVDYHRYESKAMGATKLSDIGEEWRFFDVIGIDEGQFFEDVRLN